MEGSAHPFPETTASARERVLLLVVTVAALLTGYLWYRARAVPLLTPETQTIAPGIHLLGLSPSAVYVVETTDGLVLIDTGLERDAARLRWELAGLGLDWKRLNAILLTHVHGDHCGGAEFLRAMTGARVHAGQGDVPILEAGVLREAFFSTYYMPNDSPHPTHVDVPLRGGETITVGDARFRAIATPGHTPGSVCYLMERDGLRVLFAGDIIMMLRGDEDPHSEWRKPLGTYAAYLAPRYRGNVRDFLATLRTLVRCRSRTWSCRGIRARTPPPRAPVCRNGAGSLCWIRESATCGRC